MGFTELFDRHQWSAEKESIYAKTAIDVEQA
jgi:hypothetical protein